MILNKFRTRGHTPQVASLEKDAFQQFELTLQMLNETMHLCLR